MVTAPDFSTVRMVAMAARNHSRTIARTPRHSCLRPWVVMLGSALLALGADAQAVDWTFTPRVSASETYSDNITLAPAGDEESDFVTSLDGGLSLQGRSRRLFLSLFYNLQYLNYANGTSSDRWLNQLGFFTNAELVEEWFFLDLGSNIRQENITNRGRIANSTISVTDNQTTVYTVTVSPYLKHRFGSLMDGELRYRSGYVNRDGEDTGGTSYQVLGELVSGSRFQKVPWNIYYSRLVDQPENRGDATFEQAGIVARYRFTRKYALIAGGGYEYNQFESRPDTEDTSGPTWRLGVALTPTPRTSIDAGVEDRFFGLAPFLTASHRSRRTVLTFNYSETPTTGNQITLDREFIPLTDPFGDPIIDPDTGEFTTIPIDTPTQVDQVLINRVFSGSIAFRGRRTNAVLRLYSIDRDYEVTPDEEVYGFSLSASRSLSRKLSFVLGGGWSNTLFQDNTNSDFAIWTVNAGLSRQFSPDFSGRIDVRHTSQDSDDPNRSYDENRVTLQVTKTF